MNRLTGTAVVACLLTLFPSCFLLIVNFVTIFFLLDLLPGLELAAELASTVEPLIPVWNAPLSKMNAFLAKVTGVTSDYPNYEPATLDSVSIGIPTPTPSTPNPTPEPTPIHSRSTTPRASIEPQTS